jgi:hypothetical protein
MLNSCVNPTEPSSWIDASGNLILAHPDVIRRYYREIDVTLIRENLKLTPVQRLRKLEEFVAFIKKLEGAERQSLADDVSIQVVDLDALTRLKNAAGRARNLEAVAELLHIKEKRKRISSPDRPSIAPHAKP